MQKIFIDITKRKSFIKNIDKIASGLPENIIAYADKKADKNDRAITLFEYYYISKKLKVNPADIKYGSRGKPYFDNAKEFSLSHSGGSLAIAISSSPVGADIQTILPYDEALAKSICNESELLYVTKSKNPARALTKIWVKKESLIKCKAEGFNQDLKDILKSNPEYVYKTKSYKNYEFCLCTKKTKNKKG